MLKTEKPSTVYNKLKRKYDEVSRPTSLQQVRNKKRRRKIKEESHANGNNVANQIQALENMVLKNHKIERTSLGTRIKRRQSFYTMTSR